jgi:hypothetical protein
MARSETRVRIPRLPRYERTQLPSLSVPKTIQAIGVLLRQDGVRCMNYMRLLKLLYIADRETLRRTGRPIVARRRRPSPWRMFWKQSAAWTP